MHEMSFWAETHGNLPFSPLPTPTSPTWTLSLFLGALPGVGLADLVLPESPLGEGVEDMCLALVPGWGWVESGGCPARPRVIAEAEVKVHSEPFLQAPLEMEVSATDGEFLGGGGAGAGLALPDKMQDAR